MIHMLVVVAFSYSQIAAEAVPDTAPISQRAIALGLHEHPTWLRLLQYESGPQSAVISPEFFFAEGDALDPSAELAATIAAFDDPVGEDVNAHPQCRFRARFIWLDGYLDFRANGVEIHKCPLFEAWSANGGIESVSVVLVDGYLGNPASYYGHLLLKFNRAESAGLSDLTSSTVNYGAIVPPRIDPVSYILRGVGGGFDGGFSNIEYYFHDHNYGDVELRDIWEYRLDLDPDQVALVVAHSWELLGRKFEYFFIRRNCAYRVARVLEVTSVVEVIPDSRPWTIPHVIALELGEAEVDGRPLVSNVTYRPSRRSRFSNRYDRLDHRERTVVARHVYEGAAFEQASYKDLDSASQRRVVDTLIDYYQYQTDAESIGHRADDPRYLNALAESFRLPVGDDVPAASRTDGPHTWRDPSVVRMGPVHRSSVGSGVALTIRPTYYDSLDGFIHGLRHSTLTMGEIQLMDIDGRIAVTRLDAIRIDAVDEGTSGLPGDDGSVWGLRIGAESQNVGCIDCLVAVVEGEIGVVSTFGHGRAVGAAIGGGVRSRTLGYGSLFAGPAVFAEAVGGRRLRARVSYERRYWNDGPVSDYGIFSAEFRWELSTDLELRTSYTRDVAEQISVSLGFYW